MKKDVNLEEKYIKWFFELSNKDISIAGGKGASLSEMYNAKFPVPPGFVITAQTFGLFVTESGLKEKIKKIIEQIDMENTEELTQKSKEIRKMIEEQEIPKDMETEILEAYHLLDSEKIDKQGISEDALNILKYSKEPIFVSVRSSATTEDLADASFAGQHESFLNVKGDKKLLMYVKKCFSSIYTPRAIYYRQKKGFKEEDSLLSVVVQKMIDSEKSGVIFSKDPINLNEDIVIEAVYGLGEGIVSGKINPDHYVITRDFKIKEIKIAEKKIAIVRTSSGDNEIIKLTPEKSKSRILSNANLLELANYAIKLEEHYKKPQDIEWALEEEKIYIVQSRPITTLGNKKIVKNISGKVIVSGTSGSPGIGVGNVKIINTMADLSKIKKGDVLVTEMTNPDMVVSMQRSVAIITNEGGMTSHAAIISREMGIPAVIGTGNATLILKDGMKVTVDGSTGKVYEGEVAETTFAEIKPIVETHKIKLKVIMDLPEFAEHTAKSQIDSVGLLRLEGIIAGSGKHPLAFEKENKLNEYSELLRKGIDKIAEHFKSVWIRSSDIRTDEYSSLSGAPQIELNPMLGFHGIRFSLKHPKIFEAELLAIKKVAEKYPEKKLGVMFPQVISVEEIHEAKKLFNKMKTNNMEIGVMVETPSAVQIIEELCKEGISFISFGTNDLTQYTLAIDRNNELIQYIYNESHPAMLSQIKRVITICKRYNVQTSICGQAGSRKEMVKFLFEAGIDSISVNADAAYDISNFIKELESSKGVNPQITKSQENKNNFQQHPVQVQKTQNNLFKSRFNTHFKNRFHHKNKNYKMTPNQKIEPLDNIERIGNKAEEIQEKVHEANLNKLEKKHEAESSIEVNTKEIHKKE